MKLKITPGGKSPIHQQITDQLRSAISRGQLAVGFKLPADKVWAADLGINNRTLIKALTPLVEDGLLERRPGSGTYVRAVVLPAKPADGELTLFGVRQPVTLRFLLMDYRPIQRRLWEGAFAAFNRLEPHIRIEGVFTTKRDPVAERAKQADLFAIYDRDLPSVPEGIALAPLPQDVSTLLPALRPKLRRQVEYWASTGKLHGLPYAEYSSLIHFRKELVPSSIREACRGPMPWSRFVDHLLEIETFVQEKGKDYRGSLFGPTSLSLLALDLFQKPPSSQGLLDLCQKVRNLSSAPDRGFTLGETQDQLPLFRRRTVAAWCGSISTLASEEEYGEASSLFLPRVPGSATMVTTAYACVGHGCADPSAAFAFLRFLTGEDCQRHLAQGRCQVPIREGLLQSPVFLSGAPENMSAVVDSLDRGMHTRDLRMADPSDLGPRILSALRNLVGGQTSPEQTARDLEILLAQKTNGSM